MAVVQISRIQVRRGQKNAGTGVPQLASGEFGWAVDARELYIGNGAVSEGSPQVGNTKVLTQYDNIPANTGETIQERTINPTPSQTTAFVPPYAKLNPIIAPTIECVVDTGYLK